MVWIRSSDVSGVSEDHLRQVRAAPRLSVGGYLLSPTTRISLEAGMSTPVKPVSACLEYMSTI